MNPLLDCIPFQTNGAAHLKTVIESLPDDHRQDMLQQALHRCIAENYIEEHAEILSHFLPSRLGCGSLLNILIEKDRPEMFVGAWETAQVYEKFHSQLIHMYGPILHKISHWTDLTAIKSLLTSPLVGQIKLNNYKQILSDIFYQCARNNNTELFVYLLDKVDHTCVDEYCYWSMIEHKNISAIQAAIPYIIQSPQPQHLAAYAWEDALSSQNFEVFEIMSSVSRPSEVHLCLKGEARSAFEEYMAHKQAKCIEQHIRTNETPTPPRKI